MPLQLKRFPTEASANEFLKHLAPEALKDFKIAGNNVIILYSTDHNYHLKHVNNAESTRIIDLLANHADHAWDDIDEEAGDAPLTMAISMLINQTLSYYFPDNHPLHNNRSTIIAPTIHTTFDHRITDFTQDADAWRLYIIALNSTAYDQGYYGYVVATYYRHDKNWKGATTTHLHFLDNSYQVHGNDFVLDSQTVKQWRLETDDQNHLHS